MRSGRPIRRRARRGRLVPVCCSPRDMPKRRNFGSPAGRIALVHALAHIELNAIDLAWDLIARFGVARFGDAGLPRAFFDDWVAVAAEEAEHFSLLSARLAALGSAYGELPAHDGLWEAAAATAHDLLARLAVVPLVLEARGLDVTPEMIAAARTRRRRRERRRARPHLSRRDRPCRGRNALVRVAVRARGREPRPTFHALVRRHFTGALKPPFNRRGARRQPGSRPRITRIWHAPTRAADRRNRRGGDGAGRGRASRRDRRRAAGAGDRSVGAAAAHHGARAADRAHRRSDGARPGRRRAGALPTRPSRSTSLRPGRPISPLPIWCRS